MKRVALQKAAEHLNLVKTAVDEMAAATNFSSYERAWMDFLAQASRFYNKLEQGAKNCNKSEPWFGRRKRERKKDPLLSYIHHARDCEEHAIDFTTSMSADMLRGTMPEEGDFRVSFDFMIDKNGKQHFRNVKATGPEGENIPVELVNPNIALLTVLDRRFGDSFDPPAFHLARPIVDKTPRGVASLAATYMSDMLEDAKRLPERF